MWGIALPAIAAAGGVTAGELAAAYPPAVRNAGRGVEYQRHVVLRDRVRELLHAAGNHETAWQDHGRNKL